MQMSTTHSSFDQ